MTNCPYSFPHKSRAAIAEYLDRRGRSYGYQTYRFTWDVKTYLANFDGDSLRAHEPSLDPAEDSAWQDFIENDDGGLFWIFCEDGARHISEGEWTSYPGDDQGDWDLSFAGRSSGWIVLEKWRGQDMRDVDADDFLDRDLWPWPDLVAFYRGIRTADSDFTPRKAAEEVEYQAASYRVQWEADRAEEHAAAIDQMVAELEAARPDLVPA